MEKTINSKIVLLLKSPKDAEDGDPYENVLKGNGFTPISIPVLDFKYKQIEEYTDLLNGGCSDYSAIVFTSQQAVNATEIAMQSLDERQKDLLRQHMHCFVVGKATACAAQQLGFKTNEKEAGNAELLSDIIIQNFVPNQKPLLYPCGNIRRDTLPKKLKENDILLKEITVYETVTRKDTCSVIKKVTEEKASRLGYQYLKYACRMETIIIPVDKYQVTSNVQDAYNSEICDFVETDFNTNALMEKCRMSEYGRPGLVTGNGNCLFNSLSMAICGDESLSEQIRVRTCLEMASKADKYNSHPSVKDFEILSPSYSNAFLACANNFSYSSIWTVMAAADALGTVIHSVYPPMNGTKDLAYRKFNVSFYPTFSSETRQNELSVIWTSAGPSKQKIWTPNHFCPIVKCADIDTATIDYIDNTTRDVDNVSTSENEEVHIVTDVMDDTEADSVQSMNSDSNLNNTQGSDTSDVEMQSDISADDIDINSDSDVETDGHCSTSGLDKLPVGRWYSVNEVYQKIKSRNNVFDEVPNGFKNNVCMLVDNRRNSTRRQQNQKAEYFDDCGIWDFKKGKTVTTRFIVSSQIGLTHTEQKNGLYCFKKRQKGNVVWIPFTPQPADDHIVVMHRYYTTLKADDSYRRLVSWITSTGDPDLSNIALYQYMGTFPKHLPSHGNSENTDPYYRTNPKTMERISAEIATNNPRKVYYKLKKEDPLNGPKSFKQIRDKKHREEKNRKRNEPKTNNVADELLHVIGMCGNHPFVKRVIHDSNKIPSIILYTDEQVTDLKHFVNSESGKPIGIDRTFNVGALFLTFLVYKNVRVVRKDTKEHPVFFGPMFLHKDATYETYRSFLAHVASIVEKDIDNVQIKHHKAVSFGTDEEAALTKAVEVSFPNATRMLCTKHLKDNMKHHLTEKTTLKPRQRRDVMEKVFGEDGIVNANSSFEFQNRSSAFKEITREYPEFNRYYDKHLKEKIRKYVNEPRRDDTSGDLWTNNNAESMNNIIKPDIDWKPKSLPQLIEILYEAVDLQFVDLRSAIHGEGNYRLHYNYRKFYLENMVWRTKTEEKRKDLFNKFLQANAKQNRSEEVVSSDGTFRVHVKAKSVAKKPHQSKRPRNEKANKRY